MSEEVQWGTVKYADCDPPWMVHVKWGAGQSICDSARPGELLTRIGSQVTCGQCREWAHA